MQSNRQVGAILHVVGDTLTHTKTIYMVQFQTISDDQPWWVCPLKLELLMSILYVSYFCSI